MTQTGTAQWIAGGLLSLGPLTPWIAFAMAYALTAIYTELITNNAADVLMLPIALAVSEQLGVNFLPFAVVLPDVLIDDVESDLSRDNLAAMHAIVEKPSVDEAPSNLSVVGRYVLSSRIWDLLEKTPQGPGNEIQLTDTIGMLMDDEPVEAFHIQGRLHDCGNKQGYMQTFVTYGRRHPTLGGAFSEFLAGLG